MCLRILEEVHLPALSGDMLLEVVRRKGLTAGGLDGGDEGNSRLLLFLGVRVWLMYCAWQRRTGSGQRVCWTLISL